MLVEDPKKKSIFKRLKESLFGKSETSSIGTYTRATSVKESSIKESHTKEPTANETQANVEASPAQAKQSISLTPRQVLIFIVFLLLLYMNYENYSKPDHEEQDILLFFSAILCVPLFFLYGKDKSNKSVDIDDEDDDEFYGEPIPEKVKKINITELYQSSDFIFPNIISGNKKAFFSGRLFYQWQGAEIPKIGEVVTLTDVFDDSPIVDIKFTDISILPYKDISENDAELDGYFGFKEWKLFLYTVLSNELSTYYSSNIVLAKPSYLAIQELNTVNDDFHVPQTDLSLGIKNHQIIDNFEMLIEHFEVTKIYPRTYEQWIDSAVDLLELVMSENEAKTDANVLLSHVTGKSKSQIFAFSETLLNEHELKRLSGFLIRRAKGEPIAYILREKEFWSLPLNVSENTLIPRPDTETLVEKALQIATKQLRKNPRNFRVLDLGTGTGAIALALSSELTPICKDQKIELEIIGVDLTPEIVELARSNATKNGLKGRFLQSNWFEDIEGQFDLIVSNPPYIDEKDEHLLKGDVRFEPNSALVAAENGLADLRQIINEAPKYLKNDGYLLLEHGWKQGDTVRSIFQQNSWQEVETVRDYGDNERVTLGCWKTDVSR